MKLAIMSILCALGVFSSVTGAIGVVRMPDLYSRLQCSTKNITTGALPVLVALVIGKGVVSPYASRALLIAVLMLLVSPAASHALARAAYKTGVPMWKGAIVDEPHDRPLPVDSDEPSR